MTRDRRTLLDSLRSFVCRDEQEREWLLEMHERFEPHTRLAGGLFAITLLGCLPWLDASAWLLAAGGATFGIADRINERNLVPLRMVVTWLICQGLFALAIAVGGRVGRGDLVILLVPMIGAAGGFTDRVVVVCTIYTGLLMTGLALLLRGDLVLTDPPTLMLPLGLLATTTVLTTAIRRSSIEHRNAALIDPLTGMLNRLALRARSAELEQQSALNGQPVAVLALDIDHFKAINDELGHLAGDAVLRDVAYRIRGCLRAYDLAYRVGGEEFAVLLPGATVEAATALAESITEKIRSEPVGGSHVTISIGLAGSPLGTPFRYDDVFAAADAALYTAKRDGRDRVAAAGAPSYA